MSPVIRNKTSVQSSTAPQGRGAGSQRRRTQPEARLFAGLPTVSVAQLIDDRSRQLSEADFRSFLSRTDDEPAAAILRALNDGRVLGLPAGGQHLIPPRRGVAPYAAAYVGGGLVGLKLFIASIDQPPGGLDTLQSSVSAMYRRVPMDKNIVFVIENPTLIRAFNYVVHVAQGGDTRLGTSDNPSVIFARLKLQPLLAAYAVDGLEGLKVAAAVVAQSPAQRASPLEKLCAVLDFPDSSLQPVAHTEPPPTPLASIHGLTSDHWQAPSPGVYQASPNTPGASRLPSLPPPIRPTESTSSSNVSSLVGQQSHRAPSPFLGGTETNDDVSAAPAFWGSHRSDGLVHTPLAQADSLSPLVWPLPQTAGATQPASLELQLEINGRHVTASLENFFWISAGQCPQGTEHYVESIIINRLPYRGTRADLRFLLGAD